MENACVVGFSRVQVQWVGGLETVNPGKNLIGVPNIHLVSAKMRHNVRQDEYLSVAQEGALGVGVFLN